MQSLAPDKKWKGVFPGKYGGNIWQTWNIDLERVPGRIALSNRMRRIADTSSGGLIYKFIRTNADATDGWWGLIFDTALWKNGNTGIFNGTWAVDALANTITDPRDMIIFGSANGEPRLIVSR